jgi:hypothetical protein
MSAAALLVIWAAGILLAQTMRGCPYRRVSAALQDAPTVFALGSGFVFFLFLWTCWLGPFRLTWLGLAIVLLVLLQISIHRNRAPLPPTPSAAQAKWNGLDSALAGILAVGLIISAAAVLVLPLMSWDTRILWAVKAKYLATERTILSDVFYNPYRLHIHPRYPLLLPWLAALLAQFDGVFQEYQFKIVVLLFAVLGTQQFYQLAKGRGTRRDALLLCLLLVSTGSWMQAVFASSVEVVLTFYLLTTLAPLFRWIAERRRADLVLAGLLLSGCAVVKNEGLLLALCVSVCICAPTLLSGGTIREALGAASLLLGVFLTIYSGWLIHVSFIPPVSDENYFARLSVDNLLDGSRRLGDIVNSLIERSVSLRQWHIIWLSVPLLFLYASVRGMWRTPRFTFLAGLLVLYCTSLIVIYILSPWRDIAMQIGVTFDRVALPMLPVLLLLMYECITRGAREEAALRAIMYRLEGDRRE